MNKKSNLIGIQKLENRVRLVVENMKCGGCAKTIMSALRDLGLEEIVVDPETGFVEVRAPQNEAKIDLAVAKLRSLGYPLVETEAGMKAAALKAKSYISCAIGKINS